MRRRLSWRPWLAITGVTVVLAGMFTATRPQAEPADPATVMTSLAFIDSQGYRQGEPEINVLLCTTNSPYPSCGGQRDTTAADSGKAATPEQIQAVQRTLTSMPQVQSVTFRDQAAAYAEFREEYAGNQVFNAVTVDDMPQMFHLKMQPNTDWRAVMRTAQAIPGVSSTVDLKCMQEAGESCTTGDQPPS
jgi:cell division transport system permease protein